MKEQITLLTKVCPDWLEFKTITTGQVFLKMHRNLHLTGHTIKQRIIEYYSEDKTSKKDERERSRSGEGHQIGHTPNSAFQPHQK